MEGSEDVGCGRVAGPSGPSTTELGAVLAWELSLVLLLATLVVLVDEILRDMASVIDCGDGMGQCQFDSSPSRNTSRWRHCDTYPTQETMA